MSEQRTLAALFAAGERVGVPYAAHSDTSKAAAVSQRHKSGTDRARVLAFIRGCGHLGATDDEIEVQLSLRHQTASARRNGLAKRGEVINSGRKRPTRTGRRAAVWVAADVVPS